MNLPIGQQQHQRAKQDRHMWSSTVLHGLPSGYIYNKNIIFWLEYHILGLYVNVVRIFSKEFTKFV